jgi:hypothetical protein
LIDVLPLLAAATFLSFAAAQTSAAQSVGATAPVHFDLGRRPWRAEGARVASGQPAFSVSFHGGPVQVATTAYLVWWLPKGQTLPSNYQQVIDSYFADVNGSALYGVLTDYYGSNGNIVNSVTLGGAWTDVKTYPKKIGYADVVASAKRAVAANPGWSATDINSQIYVFTSQQAPVAGDQYCAYHSYFKAGKQQHVVFAFIPDPAAIDGCQTPYDVTPNNDIDVDSATTSLNHEQAEMASDPLINAWYSDSKDPFVGGSEIADLCIFAYGIPWNAVGANMVFANGDQYVVQGLFDNTAGICAPTL